MTAASAPAATVSTANATAKATRIATSELRGNRSARNPAATTPTIPAIP